MSSGPPEPSTSGTYTYLTLPVCDSKEEGRLVGSTKLKGKQWTPWHSSGWKYIINQYHNYRGEGGSTVHHHLLLGVHLVVAVGVRLRRGVVPAPVGSTIENVFYSFLNHLIPHLVSVQ